jgi:hypothetical protein
MIVGGGGGGGPSPPVTLRRMGGREPAVVGRFPPTSVDLSVVAENPENGIVSAPNACRRAFSCLAWTERKWRRSSCHLISSRPSLDRVERGPADLWSGVSEYVTIKRGVVAYDFGAMCKKPAEFTAFSRLRRDTNAELCGSNISSPYKHLKRWGYLSGSSSCSLRSVVTLH